VIEPVAACAITVAAFAAMRRLSGALGHPPWASPVLLAALLIGAGLWAAGIAIRDYVAAAAPLRWLLAPAVVAFAGLIHDNAGLIRRQARPLLLAVAGGGIFGLGIAIGGAHLLGLDGQLGLALTTKTVTAPFVVAIMDRVGGPLGLAAALSVLTGVIGAVLVPPLLRWLRIREPGATGLAVGVSSHIVGTDWLSRRDARAGAMAALALVLVGLLAALLLVPLWPVLVGWIAG
jgi:putative effector of murein hydrolase